MKRDANPIPYKLYSKYITLRIMFPSNNVMHNPRAGPSSLLWCEGRTGIQGLSKLSKFLNVTILLETNTYNTLTVNVLRVDAFFPKCNLWSK